jgi:G3E family GTPase
VIARRYRLDGVVTTIDLTNADRTLDTQPEALKQAAMADCLLLTKSDLAEPAAIVSLERRLFAINPSAHRVRVHSGRVPPESLLGLGLFDPTTKIPDVARWLNEEVFLGTSDAQALAGAGGNRVGPIPEHGHHHEHGPGRYREHDLNRHDDRIGAFLIVLDEPLENDLFDAWLKLQLSLCGQDMLRIKGILNIQGRLRPMVVHGVQHVQHPPVEIAAWPSDDRRSRLVFITRDISRETVEESLGAFIDGWRKQKASPFGSSLGRPENGR